MNRVCICLIKFYKKNISPLKKHGSCIFYPTCSTYAIQAYSRYNFIKATGLTVWRIVRCNPFNKGGYDPVP
ncbi:MULTISPECIES: membrane protein insertion efficiency factor YidD [Eubacterium]|jgi:putative membrane protein insertion efficiency factor|uniref:membrane protein insertion efficiency factor YidD n=1 Tax=Eubacterium TaxID=1730 RepID=UPI00099A415D|nr:MULTISPECIES: membrane protein insertion efficiency factor YidD [Eubacterium]MCR5367271.1 membrane protein insertion efficiency factor YidD [Eubacterium sp.]